MAGKLFESFFKRKAAKPDSANHARNSSLVM
jgi:hypothetical protein